MTPREGFKYGFLLRCAEEGLTVKEAEARAARALEKNAAGFWGTTASGLGGIIPGVVGGLANIVPEAAKSLVMASPTLALTGLGAAAVGTGVGGYMLGKSQESDIDPEEVQREELIAAYKTQTELARRKAIMDAIQQGQSRPRSRHGI